MGTLRLPGVGVPARSFAHSEVTHMRSPLPGALVAATALALACGSARDIADTGGSGNCTDCHGTATNPYPPIANPVLSAPPRSVSGETDASHPRVGAHRRHLQGGAYSDPFVCATCHLVPTNVAHLDGVAQVELSGAGQRSLAASLGTYTPSSQTCAVYCHDQNGGQNRTPSWTLASPLACNACHGQPPPSGTGSVNGYHTSIVAHASAPCASCHLGYVQGTNVELAQHVNGDKDVVFPRRGGGGTTSLQNPGWLCSTCHTADASGNANARVFP